MQSNHLVQFIQHKTSLCVGIVFSIMGFLFGVWATAIPFVKNQYNLNDQELGILLLFLPFGTIFINPFLSKILAWKGVANCTFWGANILAFAYAIPTNVNNIYLLAASLLFVGFSISLTNISMNIAASLIEELEGKKILATCHGMFSVGLMLGSFGGSLAYGLGVECSQFAILVSIGILALLHFILKSNIYKTPVRKTPTTGKNASFVLPKGLLLIIILISVFSNFIEGAMPDWSGIYLKEIIHAEEIYWGLGITTYSFMMASGRFFGDSIIPKWGSKKVVQRGGFLVFISFILITSIDNVWVSLLGFATIGLGISCVAPIMYSQASKIPDLKEGVGLATLNSFSIAGFLFGPVLIGIISEATNLKIAFIFLTVLVGLWIVLSYFFKPR